MFIFNELKESDWSDSLIYMTIQQVLAYIVTWVAGSPHKQTL